MLQTNLIGREVATGHGEEKGGHVVGVYLEHGNVMVIVENADGGCYVRFITALQLAPLKVDQPCPWPPIGQLLINAAGEILD